MLHSLVVNIKLIYIALLKQQTRLIFHRVLQNESGRLK